jgi:hypothetical protein
MSSIIEKQILSGSGSSKGTVLLLFIGIRTFSEAVKTAAGNRTKGKVQDSERIRLCRINANPLA